VAFAVRDVVRDPQGQAFLVQAMPTGGLKTVTPSLGPGAWLTALPGEMGLLGLLIHKLVYRGRWTVLVRPLVGNRPSTPSWTEEAKNMRAANAVAEQAMEKIRTGTWR
jgi:hypothetical protein